MRRAQRRAVSEPLREFREWAVTSEALGCLRRSMRQGPIPARELWDDHSLVYHPKGTVDLIQSSQVT
eukprot:5973331-Pyramimonas_sp.AAC.1